MSTGLPNAFAPPDESGANPAYDRNDFSFEDEIFGPDDSGGSPPAGSSDHGSRAPSGGSAPSRQPAAGTPAGRQESQAGGGSPQSAFTEEDYQDAEEWGFSRAEVDRLGSPEMLDRVLANAYRAAQRFAAQAGGQAQNPGNNGQQVPGQGGQQPNPSQPAAGQLSLPKFDRKLLEQFEESDRKVFEQMLDTQEKAFEQYVLPLNQQLQAVQEHFQRQQFEAAVADFDRSIGGLGETWKDLFGEGSSANLNPRSPEARNREAVFEEMQVLAEVYQQRGRRVPSRDVLFDKAVKSVFGDRSKQEARHEIKTRLRDQRGRFTEQPTHRDGKPLTGEEAAIRYAEGKYREMGLRGSNDDDFEL